MKTFTHVKITLYDALQGSVHLHLTASQVYSEAMLRRKVVEAAEEHQLLRGTPLASRDTKSIGLVVLEAIPDFARLTIMRGDAGYVFEPDV